MKSKIKELLVFSIILIILVGSVYVIGNRKADGSEFCSLEVVICKGEEIPMIEPIGSGIEEFEGIQPSQRGVASYYDYVLESGWSSVGHKVCAVRIKEWRYHTIKVTDISTGRSANCRVTDYGPDAAIFPERIVDLSSYAFSRLMPLKYGVIDDVVIELID